MKQISDNKMIPLRRSLTIKSENKDPHRRNSSRSLLPMEDPFGDANCIPKKVGTIFPQLDISKLKSRSKWNSIFTAALNVLILVLLNIENQMFNANKYESNVSENMLRTCIIFLSIVSIGLILQYYSIKLYLKKAYRECHVNSSIWDYPNLRDIMVIEIFFCIVNVPPYCDWTFSFKQMNAYSLMSVDDILVAFSFIRLYFIFKMIYECTIYSSERAEHVCNLENVRDMMKFSLKCLLNTKTYFSIFFLFGMLIISGGILLRIFERTTSNTTFDYIWNGFYTVGITALGIGYGDNVPTTHLGRVVCVAASIFGVFSVSYTVWAVQNSISFNHDEFHIYDIMVFKKNIKKRLEPFASTVLQRWWILIKKRKLKVPRLKELSAYNSQLIRFILLKNQMKGETAKTMNENVTDFSNKMNICMPKIFHHLELSENTLKVAIEMTNNQLFLVEKIKKIQLNLRSFKTKFGDSSHGNDNHRRGSDRSKRATTLVEMKKAQFRAIRKLIIRKTSESSFGSQHSSPRPRMDALDSSSDVGSDR